MIYTELSCKKLKARKAYRCIWCGEPIRAGEKYIRGVGVFEGEFLSQSLHPECAAASAKDKDAQLDGFELFSYSRGCMCAKGQCECGYERDHAPKPR